MANIGWPEIVIVVVLTVLLVMIPAKILAKAGYSPWLGLTLLIPVANFIAVIWFAFADWPVLRQIRKADPPRP